MKTAYDAPKEFQGKRYAGMKVGRRHVWRYDAGEWTERKVTPDRWELEYSVVKRRKGRAPEGSGAPVGTAYHWYIVADQTVTKLDANSYMTEMVGHKLKVAHRRADKTSWSAIEKAKRKLLVKLLRELADDLEARPLEDPSLRGDGVPTAPRASNNSRAKPASRASHRAKSPARTMRAAHSSSTHSAKKPSTRARPRALASGHRQ